MYESLKNRIAALEEEEVLEEEEERQFGVHFPSPSLPLFSSSLAEEAVKSVRGMGENAVHAKYIELVCVRDERSLPHPYPADIVC